MKRDPFEVETLTIFRLFIRIQWLLLTLALIALYLKHRPIPDYLTILSWGLTTFHLVYLSWPWLSRVLGARYLPIALITISIGPVINQALTPVLLLYSGMPESAALVDTGTFYIGLLLPLLLISLQYKIRTLFVFSGGTALLSILFTIVVTPHHKLIINTTIMHALDRFMLFSLAGVIIVLLSQVRRKQHQELIQKNVQLAHYATMQEQLTVSRERNRIARELHDTLAHTLSALSVQLKATEVLCETNAQDTLQAIKQMQAVTINGLQDARRALRALRISAIEELGLVLALKQLADQTTQQAGLSLSLHLPDAMTDISTDVEQHLYRIAEEALNNVVRHANAKHLTLSLSQDSTGVQLTILDDGVGFEASPFVGPKYKRNIVNEPIEHTEHYGLSGMRERAMLIDASLDISSTLQQGTKIQVCV